MPGLRCAARLCALLFAIPLAIAACRSVPAPLPLPPGDPRPRAVLDAWEASARDRQALRGVARLAVDGEAGGREVRIRGTQRIVVARPARLRVEILGFLSQTLAVLVVDGRRFELFEAETRRVEEGPVYPSLLWDVARLALEPQEAVALVLGSVAPNAALEVARSFRGPEGAIRVELSDGAGIVRQRARFDAEARLRRLEIVDERGAPLWVASFDAYQELDGTPVAHEIALDTHATRAELSLEDIELNPALPPGVFRLGAPGTAGTRRAPEAGE